MDITHVNIAILIWIWSCSPKRSTCSPRESISLHPPLEFQFCLALTWRPVPSPSNYWLKTLNTKWVILCTLGTGVLFFKGSSALPEQHRQSSDISSLMGSRNLRVLWGEQKAMNPIIFSLLNKTPLAVISTCRLPPTVITDLISWGPCFRETHESILIFLQNVEIGPRPHDELRRRYCRKKIKEDEVMICNFNSPVYFFPWG